MTFFILSFSALCSIFILFYFYFILFYSKCFLCAALARPPQQQLTRINQIASRNPPKNQNQRRSRNPRRNLNRRKLNPRKSRNGRTRSNQRRRGWWSKMGGIAPSWSIPCVQARRSSNIPRTWSPSYALFSFPLLLILSPFFPSIIPSPVSLRSQ